MLRADPSQRLARRLLVGVGVGVVPAAALAVVGPPVAGAAFGVAFGVVYALAFAPSSGTALDHALGGAALAVPAWLLVRVTLYPLAVAGAPAWTAAGVGALLPDLVAWVLGGAGCGAAASLAGARLDDGPETDEPRETDRIVVVGGGFAGVAAAERLEERFGPDPGVELTLVSETNALLFTPMLAEVAAGSLEPTQITSPHRTTLRRTRVVRATAKGVDFDAKQVVLGTSDGTRTREPAETVADGGAAVDRLDYDHLVLATGSETAYFGMDGVRSFAFELKTLDDAVSLRNHVIDCFERAERTDDPQRRRELLTFVVAGGGFAGAELAGALNDFAHEMLSYYPALPPEAVTVRLVHSGDRVMPALSESLSAYALDRLRDRGVAVDLDTRVDGADPETGTVTLGDGRTLDTETLVWTAGVRPDPFVETLDLPRDESGAVRAEPTFAVPDREGVWAVGDCAAVEDPETGDPHPATAQYATRAGEHLADNVHAAVTGGDPEPMSYSSKGQLAVIGYQSACAEVNGWRFSGLFAWLLWRAVYLFKLPGTGRKIRVFVNWLVELVFPRDVVQTTAVDRREADDGGA